MRDLNKRIKLSKVNNKLKAMNLEKPSKNTTVNVIRRSLFKVSNKYDKRTLLNVTAMSYSLWLGTLLKEEKKLK